MSEVAKKYHITQVDPASKELVTYDIRTGEEVARAGQLVPKARFAYTLRAADLICFHLREGKSIHKIAKMPNMPGLHVLYRWMEVHPDFKERVKRAKGGRADYYRDKAEDSLDRCSHSDEVKLAKLKFDGYMKLAEKDNPADYGSVRESGGGNAPLQIIVQTGIMRDDPVTVEVKNERQDGTDLKQEQSSGASSFITIESEESREEKRGAEARSEEGREAESKEEKEI